MKAAMYLRVSTAEQKEKQTIATQRIFGERYFAAHDILVYREYADDGVSGVLPLEQRPEGSRLLADARSRKIDTLFVYRLDRLARDPLLILNLFNQLESLGIQIQSMTENIDTTSPSGRFLVTILGGVAGLERDTIMQRSIAGTNRLARGGAWLGGIVPYGYLAVGQREDSRLILSEKLIPGLRLSEAAVVRMIYQLTVEKQLSCEAIAEHLNSQGIPAKHLPDEDEPARGKRHTKLAHRWTSGQIRNMLVSQTYKGLHQYGRRTQKERELFEREVPPLVSIDLWEQAQQILRDHQLVAAREKTATRPYLLRGLITCELCGLTYLGTATRPYKNTERCYYACGGKHKGRGPFAAQGKTCPSKRLNAITLETAVWNDIEKFLRVPGDVMNQLMQQMHVQEGHRERLQDEMAKHQHALQASDSERDRVITLFRKARIDEYALDRQLDHIQQEVAAVRKHFEAAQEQLRDLQEKEAGLRYAHELLQRLALHLAQPLTWDLQRELVEALVEQIRVATREDSKGRKEAQVTVTYRFGPSTAIGMDTDSLPQRA